MNKMLTEWQKIKEYGEKINEETRAKIKMSNKTLKNIEFLELIKNTLPNNSKSKLSNISYDQEMERRERLAEQEKNIQRVDAQTRKNK
tara:strand:+ start:374 stop:637 length:264 start_codon:yes stop_codon:yes gene_type:complete